MSSWRYLQFIRGKFFECLDCKLVSRSVVMMNSSATIAGRGCQVILAFQIVKNRLKFQNKFLIHSANISVLCIQAYKGIAGL